MRAIRTLLTSLLILNPIAGLAAAGGEKLDLLSLSLKELSELRVTSVSKTPQDWFRAPAAIHVITGEAIRRSGVTSLPEALRLAPGVHVARLSANQWAIGIRGFQDRLSRATLVMIDGRSVYTPLFAGTYWELQDVMLEDVDRIEVIRGPGGAVWGANAVNGVINIITKSAADTPGMLATAGGGSEERAFGSVRYGGRAGETTHYRVYGKYFDRDSSFAVGTIDEFDDWRMGQAGFRTDWEPGSGQTVTVQGDAYEGRAGQRVGIATYTSPFSQILRDDTDLFGANVLGRWSRAFESSRLTVQFYYDHTDRDDPDFREVRDTVDLDVQHTVSAGSRHTITYGAGHRLTADDTDGIPTIKAFEPDRRTLELWNVFAQDEIELVREKLDLTLGAKAEKNEYTGWEYQPSGRLSWSPTPKQNVWGAVSRAVRTPSRVDREPSIAISASPPPPSIVTARFTPNDAFESETLLAYELGYRAQPVPSFFSGVSGFYNRYDDVQSLNILPVFVETNPPPAKAVLPFIFENRMTGRIYGIEANTAWDPVPWWRLEALYSYAHLNFHPKEGSTDGVSENSLENSSPQHQAVFRSSLDLPGSVEIDPMFRYVSSVPDEDVPAYWTADLRIGWSNARRNLEVAVVGQNLLQPRHAEYGATTEVQRGVYGKVTWRR